MAAGSGRSTGTAPQPPASRAGRRFRRTPGHDRNAALLSSAVPAGLPQRRGEEAPRRPRQPAADVSFRPSKGKGLVTGGRQAMRTSPPSAIRHMADRSADASRGRAIASTWHGKQARSPCFVPPVLLASCFFSFTSPDEPPASSFSPPASGRGFQGHRTCLAERPMKAPYFLRVRYCPAPLVMTRASHRALRPSGELRRFALENDRNFLHFRTAFLGKGIFCVEGRTR